MKHPKRGEIWLVDWSPGRGSEQQGRRPAVVAQTDAANSNTRYPNTIVAAVSTKGRPVATHVEIQPSKENGLRKVSFAKCEQIFTIDKNRLLKRWGKVDRSTMDAIDLALQAALSL